MQSDILIIGGGIVGLASALKIKEANPNLSVTLLEKEAEVAKHQTGNNSGVIHSGLYYKPGSLKATNCINGYHMLIDFCEAENIPFELTGKVVVATKTEQIPLLNNLYERGQQNKLDGNRKISADEVKEYEPYVRCVEGMWVPQTGIVDYKLVSQKIAGKLKSLGVELHFSTKVTGITKGNSINIISTDKGAIEAK